MKSEKLKRYRVTQSVRFTSAVTKILYHTGLLLVPLGALVFGLSFFVPALEPVKGVSLILAILGFIWVFAIRISSDSNFGSANVSFTRDCIIFRLTLAPDSEEFRLRWSDAVCAGMEKTRGAWWVYVSDHELLARERREFPELAEKGVFYFGYEDNAWDELMKFAPERLAAALEAQRDAAGIKPRKERDDG